MRTGVPAGLGRRVFSGVEGTLEILRGEESDRSIASTSEFCGWGTATSSCRMSSGDSHPPRYASREESIIGPDSLVGSTVHRESADQLTYDEIENQNTI